MLQSIIEFLQSNPTTIIGHPIFIKSAKILTLLITDPCWIGKSILFVIDDSEKINSSLSNKLPESFFCPYSGNEKLKNYLQSDNEYYIFYENLSHFSNSLADNELKELYKQRSSKVKIVIFATLGITQKDLNDVISINQDTAIVYLGLDDFMLDIDFGGKIMSNFTEVQNENYTLATTDEEKLKIGNLAICPDITGMVANPDLEENNHGWMRFSDLSNSNYLSPKITQLIHNLVANKELKHVIYTKFYEKCGGCYIYTLLTFMKVKCLLIGPNENQEKKCNLYNEAKSGSVVIFAGCYPKCELKSVNIIHFLEGFDYIEYNNVVSNILIRKNYSHRKIVKINFYLAKPDIRYLKNGETIGIDEEKYSKFSYHIGNNYKTFVELEKGYSIEYVDGKGLCINTEKTYDSKSAPEIGYV